MKTINETTYVDCAEAAIKALRDRSKKDKSGNPMMVTTSQIRNLLSLISAIGNDVLSFRKEDLSDSIKERIAYLKVRFLYDAGRDPKVKSFVETAKLIDIVKKSTASARILCCSADTWRLWWPIIDITAAKINKRRGTTCLEKYKSQDKSKW